jgi:hypothetical protein
MATTEEQMAENNMIGQQRANLANAKNRTAGVASLESQLAEAEKMAGVCAESAKMWQEKADKLRAQRDEKRGPFGMSGQGIALGVVRIYHDGPRYGLGYSTDEPNDYSVTELERVLIDLRDALNAATGLVAVKEATDEELHQSAAVYANNYKHWATEEGLKQAYLAGAGRRSR